MDSRNLGREMYERRTPKSLEFISGRYHVLRKIYRKFGRIFFVKRISLYLESRARPVEKLTSKFHRQHNSGRPPNYRICTTEINFQGKISKILIHIIYPQLKHISINKNPFITFQ